MSLPYSVDFTYAANSADASATISFMKFHDESSLIPNYIHTELMKRFGEIQYPAMEVKRHYILKK